MRRVRRLRCWSKRILLAVQSQLRSVPRCLHVVPASLLWPSATVQGRPQPSISHMRFHGSPFPPFPSLLGRLTLYCMSAFVRSGATDILALDPTILLQWPSAAAAVVSSRSLLHRQVVSQPHAGRGSSCTSDVWFGGGWAGGISSVRRFLGMGLETGQGSTCEKGLRAVVNYLVGL